MSMADGGKKHRVLIVEDEDNIAIALDYLMSREGYDHDRIANGADALAAIRKTRPDLVLLDVMLPEVSGYEICQEVRADESLRDVKILMMTARGSALERRKGLALGADGFIAKPFELKELRAEVHRLLQQEGSTA
jgi:DNA-binding response OmpR family regulator